MNVALNYFYKYNFKVLVLLQNIIIITDVFIYGTYFFNEKVLVRSVKSVKLWKHSYFNLLFYLIPTQECIFLFMYYKHYVEENINLATHQKNWLTLVIRKYHNFYLNYACLFKARSCCEQFNENCNHAFYRLFLIWTKRK